MMITSNHVSSRSIDSRKSIECDTDNSKSSYCDYRLDIPTSVVHQEKLAKAAPASPDSLIKRASTLVGKWKQGTSPSSSPAVSLASSPHTRSSSIRTDSTAHTTSIDSQSSSAEFNTGVGRWVASVDERKEEEFAQDHQVEEEPVVKPSFEFRGCSPPASSIQGSTTSSATINTKQEERRSLVNMLAQAMVNVVLLEENEDGERAKIPSTSTSLMGNTRRSSEPILPVETVPPRGMHPPEQRYVNRRRSMDLPPRVPPHHNGDEDVMGRNVPSRAASTSMMTRRIVQDNFGGTVHSTSHASRSTAGTRSSASSGTTSGCSSDNSSRHSATIETIEQVQAYVMSQLPRALKEQLSPEKWKDVIESAVQAHYEEQAAKRSQNGVSSSSSRSKSATDTSSSTFHNGGGVDGFVNINSENHSSNISSSEYEYTLSLNDLSANKSEADDDDEHEFDGSRSVISDLTFPTFESHESNNDIAPKAPMKRPSVGDFSTQAKAAANAVVRNSVLTEDSSGELVEQRSAKTAHCTSPTMAVEPAVSKDSPPRIPGRLWHDGTNARALQPPSMPTRNKSGGHRSSSLPTSSSTWDDTDGFDQLPHGLNKRRSLEHTGQLMLSSSSSHGPSCASPAKSNMSSNRKTLPKRAVSFDSVHVRYYERVLDVNPCTSSGPSVGLGWNYVPTNPKKVDKFEYDRKFGDEESTEGDDGQCPASSFKREYKRKCASHRIYGGPMPLPRHVREALVRDWGYTQKEIARAIRHTIRAKNQRRQTANNLRAQKVEEIVESSKRKVRQLLSFGGVGSGILSSKDSKSKKDKKDKKQKKKDARNKKDSSSYEDELLSNESSCEMKDPLDMDTRKVVLLESRWE